MSFHTWVAEFYPKPADKVKKKDAVAHSLQKWKGLTPENMARHEVTFDFRAGIVYLVEVPHKILTIRIDDSSCALCHHYFSEPDCKDCPITKFRNRRCYGSLSDPWAAFRDDRDPKPMIRCLEKVLANVD